MGERCLLVGDIGGTSARFALASSQSVGYSREATYNCADFATSEDAIRRYLDSVCVPRPHVVCLAAAGPIVDGSIQFTNNHWRVSDYGLRESFSPEVAVLLNDFEAIAHALPHLKAEDCQPLGDPPAPDLQSADFTVAAMGPGTGLGAAGLVCEQGRRIALKTEAGHVGFAPETPLQCEVRDVLAKKFGRVSDERLVSGMGLENIYRALGDIHGKPVDALSAAEIFERRRAGSDPLAVETANLFFEVLGQVTGNFALSIGAFDGVYLVGGVAQKHGDLLASSRYRDAFESKGRHSAVMKRVPSALVRHPQPGLLGASAVACALSGR